MCCQCFWYGDLFGMGGNMVLLLQECMHVHAPCIYCSLVCGHATKEVGASTTGGRGVGIKHGSEAQQHRSSNQSDKYHIKQYYSGIHVPRKCRLNWEIFVHASIRWTPLVVTIY